MQKYMDSFIEYITLQKHYSNDTVINYTKDLDDFYNYLDIKRISSLNMVDYNVIRGYLMFLHEKEYSKKTISRHISTLKSFFKYLMQNEIIELEMDVTGKHLKLKEKSNMRKDRYSSISYGIYFKPWSQFASYPVLVELLNNLGIVYSELPSEDLFVMVNTGTGERREMRLFETLESEFADFSLFYNEDGHLEFTNSEAESMILTNSDIGIVVFDNTDLSFVDQANFVLKDMPLEFKENL